MLQASDSGDVAKAFWLEFYLLTNPLHRLLSCIDFFNLVLVALCLLWQSLATSLLWFLTALGRCHFESLSS